ncbi:MAG: MopE-related protein [Bacteroidota bacterium]
MKKKAHQNNKNQFNSLFLTATFLFGIFFLGTPAFADTGENVAENTSFMPCNLGSLQLATQADVDAFVLANAGCTSIHADLLVGVTSGSSDIHDLSGFSTITALTFRIRIERTQLTNLHGLHNLTTLHAMQLYRNSQLVDISALSNISAIGSSLQINGNTALTSLHGLHNVQTVAGTLGIYNHPYLTDLDALISLQSIGRHFEIFQNFQLNSLTGLSNLTSVGKRFGLINADALSSLDGLDNLSTVGDRFQIASNNILTDCCAIYDLLNTPGALGGSIIIGNNQTGCDNQSEITDYCTDDDMDGYNEIEGDCDDADAAISPGAIEICDGIDNDCNGLIDDGVASAYNGNLIFSTQAQVNAFSSCIKTINGSVTILGANVTDLSNLSTLEGITGNLSIQSTGLSNLNGLNGLQSVGGMALIYFNGNLVNLSGLNNLMAVGGNFMMYYNFQLSDCCAIQNVLNNGGVAGSTLIYLNSSGCNSVSDINATCNQAIIQNENGATAIEPSIGIGSETKKQTFGINVFPNPNNGVFQVNYANLTSPERIRLVNSTGQVVWQKELTPRDAWVDVDVQGSLPTGIYLLQIGQEATLITKKVVLY